MAFLDNSGDIILDAVLTDTGRMRLARGDGSFKITKYAFADDEIDYSTFNANHSSGSAYYDLEILQTPVLEAFTNNTATMKSKLISISNNNLLYLPILKLNENIDSTKMNTNTTLGSGSFLILVDADTVRAFKSENIGGTTYSLLDDNKNFLNDLQGIHNGFQPSTPPPRTIRIDQGLNTTEISAQFAIDPELKETQYIIEMDNRLGRPYATSGGPVIPAVPAFIDDDNIASYYITQTTGDFVKNSATGPLTGAGSNTATQENESIQGPRGSRLSFSILSSLATRTSSFLFDQLGGTIDVGTFNINYIDTTVRVTGATTGYKMDVPVRYVKLA